MELTEIKARNNGLWFYDNHGVLIMLVESKDFDCLQLAMKESEKLAGSSDYWLIPMQPPTGKNTDKKCFGYMNNVPTGKCNCNPEDMQECAIQTNEREATVREP